MKKFFKWLWKDGKGYIISIVVVILLRIGFFYTIWDGSFSAAPLFIQIAEIIAIYGFSIGILFHMIWTYWKNKDNIS